MERIFSDFTPDFSDQYIPSGTWYPPPHDESNDTSSFFPSENHPPLDYPDNNNSWCNNQSSLHQNDPKRTLNDPFSVRCRIPVPDSELSGYPLWLETSFMCRRNERERQRVRNVNDGFSRLRNHLPRGVHVRRRQSKVDTLRHAIEYIRQLQTMLEDKKGAENAS